MIENYKPTQKEIIELREKLIKEAEEGGYHINPDLEFTDGLVEGLLINIKRYGYMACPCRLASGDRDKDRDIICPCDYRDADLDEFGTCYCGLYVSEAVLKNKKEFKPIPERRNTKNLNQQKKDVIFSKKLPYTIWRCKVCGYLCARDNPPERCPVCKAGKERFEEFL